MQEIVHLMLREGSLVLRGEMLPFKPEAMVRKAGRNNGQKENVQSTVCAVGRKKANT